MKHALCLLLLTSLNAATCRANDIQWPAFSGIYPHLAVFNDEGECGTGAVVPWADRLWVITYAPHKPAGSSDKLYEIDVALNQIIRKESVGGTPANRMIHTESQQLFIGPYVVDAKRNVRVLPSDKMFGRLTGNARHLTDPANKIYYATMEEGLYEVDVKTLAVKELWADEQRKTGRHADLPGYHGKGLYSGQGRIIYANNGDHAKEALVDPATPSGALAEWDGQAENWNIIRRNQFTEVTGPGGIMGNTNPATDPVWSIGWDHRSLILMLLENNTWHSFRLPKASHSYDGAHGWNTEWPRIRDIGENDLLMTMHGTFWRFPKTFSVANSAGILPRSNYLKVVGDFCRWNDRIVLGCDDTAKNEFLNKRKAKGNLAGPGQSQSNLQFIAPAQLDQMGPVIGRGAVWLNEPIKTGQTSDAYLFAGYDRRMAHLSHDAGRDVTFSFEIDRKGDGRWTNLKQVVVPSAGYAAGSFTKDEAGIWIRVRGDQDCKSATVFFNYQADDKRTSVPDAMFAGMMPADATTGTGGLLRARGENKRTLHMAALKTEDGKVADVGYYEMNADMKLRRVEDNTAHDWLRKNAAIPADAITIDAASVLYADEQGRRFRIPKSREDLKGAFGGNRVVREVCTERDMLSVAGGLFELPAENAGGFAKIRPVASHPFHIHDFATWRGLLVISGIQNDAPANPRIIKSDDGKAAVWVGAVDDLWSLGKPTGTGGPLNQTAIKANEPSDAYLMTAYDRKSIALSQDGADAVRMTIEVDITGTGEWKPYRTFEVPPGRTMAHDFPADYQAYWLRIKTNKDCKATAMLKYE